MNMLGFGLAVKGLNEMSKRGGSGGSYNAPNAPTEEEYLYGDCLDIIRECAKMPAMEDLIIPFEATRKLTRADKKKHLPKQENHEIYIAQINPHGVKFPGIETHTGLSPVIGTIDGDKMFVYSVRPESLEIFWVEEYAYDHMGDFHYRTGSVVKDGLNRKFDEIRLKSVKLTSARDVRPNGSSTITSAQERFTVRDNWIKVADIVGRQRRACIERSAEPTETEPGK